MSSPLFIRVDGLEAVEKIQLEQSTFSKIVETAAGTLAMLVKGNAPVYTGKPKKGVVSGALRGAIIPSPWRENAPSPYKEVRQVMFDRAKNDLLVKYNKHGDRFYYPASQEYGFRARRGGYFGTEEFHVPGKFFMSNSLVTYVPYFESDIEKAVDEALSK